MRQVLTNLIANAIDAMPQGGQLYLEVGAEGPDVRIVVGDTGIGISADRLQDVFEPFYTTKGEQGLGIGLWISQNVIKRLGGSIEVSSSTEGGRQGTRFTICLPVRASLPEREAQNAD